MTRAWSRDWAPFEPVGEWTDEFLDWAEKRDLERPREMNAASGWRCIRPGTAEGPLMGGCLESIAWHLRKSEIWTEPTDAIFFIESSEETPSPEYVDAYLTTFERDGLFDAAAGLIVARPYGYTDDDKEVLFEVIERRTEDSGIPVLADVDIGHTDPDADPPDGGRGEPRRGRPLLLVALAAKMRFFGPVAQLVERTPRTGEASGSNPLRSTEGSVGRRTSDFASPAVPHSVSCAIGE